MDAAIDIFAQPNAMNLGLKHVVPVRAAVGHIGVFNLAWKEVRRIPVPAGDHTVAIWSKLARKPWQGLSHAIVHVAPGQVVALKWTMPTTLFGSGSIICGPIGPPVSLAPLDASSFPSKLGPCQLTPPHPVESLTGGAVAVAPAPVPMAAAAASAVEPGAGWHPDPSGRHRLRWWDGARWTENVSDGARNGIDPVPGLTGP